MGRNPTVRVKRSKKADLDSATSVASSDTVHARSGRACICRSAVATRASVNPRSSL